MQFLKSTLIVLTVSFVGSFGLSLLGMSFWGTLIAITIFQYILFSFIGSILTQYITNDVRKKELDKLENLSTILQCAYCSKPNLMTFYPDDSERFEFECEHCKNKNLVAMQFVVAQVSQPLEIPKVTGVPSMGNAPE